MTRIGWVRTAGLGLFCALFALSASISPALASKPSITSCPSNVTTNADGTFSFEVTVTNTGNPGDVELHGSGTANISGLEIYPDHHVFDTGESYTYHVSGTLSGASGTVSLSLEFSGDVGGQQAVPGPGVIQKRPQQLFLVHITHG